MNISCRLRKLACAKRLTAYTTLPGLRTDELTLLDATSSGPYDRMAYLLFGGPLIPVGPPARGHARIGSDTCVRGLHYDDFISSSRRSPFKSFFTALDATTSPSLA